MDEKILQTLLKKATGYTHDEIVEEYSASDDGVELVKRKETKKYYPPDCAALKTYLELKESNLSQLDTETLKKEKNRLLKELEKKK